MSVKRKALSIEKSGERGEQRAEGESESERERQRKT